MEFGFCYIPDYHPELHGAYTDWYARIRKEWKLADALGFDAVWIAEHRYPGYGFSSTPVVAQWLADNTSSLKVGTAVALLSQRHPVTAAEDWAAVDLLSGGRLRFGIGRGIYPYDFDVLGIPSSESRERFEEAWELIRRLWSEDTVAHEGKFWRIPEPGHRLGPKPLQQPTPPVYVGCVASPESYVWAGQHGYHVIVSPFLLDSTERQRTYLDLYRDALEKSGRDPAAFQVLANYHLAILNQADPADSHDEYFYRYLAFVAETSAKGKLDPSAYAAYRPGSGMFRDVEEMRRHRTVIGTTQQCVDRMGTLARECGLDGWMFHVNYGGIPHERVAEQMHRLREAANLITG